MKPHHNCPVQATVNAISGKWKVQILWHLSFEPLGFAGLGRKLKTISEKVLTQQLRELESCGIVARKVHPTRPPRVDYSLTAAGEKLVPMMQQLCDWGSAQFKIKPTLVHRATRPRC
jgi:DNA-binding HxlR family transcriptional regulator